ncbi:hypothetical protein [Spirosoma fluminis]
MPDNLSISFRSIFKEVTQQVLDDKWTVFGQAHTWQEVFPYPDLSTLPRATLPRLITNAISIRMPSLREQQLTWSLWATEFFNRHKERVSQNRNNMERHLADELAVWNRNHPEKNEQLPLEKMFREWLTHVEHLSLKEFATLAIGPTTARDFLTPKFDELKERYGIKPVVDKKHKQSTTILIKKEARLKLINEILPYVNEAQHINLKSLIDEGKSPSEPIICDCEQVRLGEIFYERVKAKQKQERQIEADKTQLARWIHDNFRRIESGTIKKLSESTLLNHLKGKGFAQYR